MKTNGYWDDSDVEKDVFLKDFEVLPCPVPFAMHYVGTLDFLLCVGTVTRAYITLLDTDFIELKMSFFWQNLNE